MGVLTRTGGREAIVVLGYKNGGTHANCINRYRVRAAIRSIDQNAADSVLVFCGSCVAGAIAEAELMAQYARLKRGYTRSVVTETESRTTSENIQNVIPLIEYADVIRIVSNSLHAEKGRGYLWTLRPDLARRLAPAKEHRFGEITFVKAFLSLISVKRVRSRPDRPSLTNDAGRTSPQQ